MRHSEAHRHATLDLTLAAGGVDGFADIMDGCIAFQINFARAFVHTEFHGVCTKACCGVATYRMLFRCGYLLLQHRRHANHAAHHVSYVVE